ncbi:hypothetical protein niasHT_029924 [Heterodera trifolii]|uniref:CCHC-type domain-containing protein n=1 Tax=Heterodera trifolii TaxID=157864 RepID=A0ABD2KCG9_9BILA
MPYRTVLPSGAALLVSEDSPPTRKRTSTATDKIGRTCWWTFDRHTSNSVSPSAFWQQASTLCFGGLKAISEGSPKGGIFESVFRHIDGIFSRFGDFYGFGVRVRETLDDRVVRTINCVQRFGGPKVRQISHCVKTVKSDISGDQRFGGFKGSWVILAHLVARLPKLEKVFVTGDRYQLGVHLQELPKILRKGFGLDSMVDQLVDSPNVVQNKLVTCYRMHPMLVECVSYASYEQHGERLGVGRSAEERSILTNSQFPLPMQNCPIVLMNVSGTCRQGVESFSLTNDVHTASAVQLVAALSGNLSRQDISIVVICLYLLQKDCIKSEFEDLGLNILVVSVDEYQAQEADITVVVTTRSSYREGNLSENSEFLTDSQRATVALSRARHGLFLIGDFAVLSVGEVWQRFIERASALTQIVGQSYIQLLRSGEFRRDRFGQLLDGEYRVVGDWAAGTSAASSTSTTTRQPTGETWRNWNVGRPLERKRLATEDIGPAPRRDENWRSTSWRQFTGTTFSRGGRGGSSTKCYNCGRTGHVARQCQERRRDDRR